MQYYSKNKLEKKKKELNDEKQKALLSHISLSLKSFDLQVSEWKTQTVLGHLQSLYKKKKYIFYIVQELEPKDICSIKFKSTIQWCKENKHIFVIIAKSWDPVYNEYSTSNNLDWKIIPINKLTQLGKEYIDAKEKEKYQESETIFKMVD